MSSSTLLVNMESGSPNTGLLEVATVLAERLKAVVIGITARQPMQLDVTGTCYIPAEVINEERAETEAEMHAAEVEFRAAFPGREVDWRASLCFGAPAGYIVDQARHADLLLTGMPLHTNTDRTRVSAGELVMQCGRPVLVVPVAPATPSLDRVMLAWKDTRESRRATLDALPLLRRATHVTVVEIAADDDMVAARQHVADVSRWLATHGLAAETRVVASEHDDPAQLESLAHRIGANLIVAGAYGHSRLREWVFGGVTQTLLQQGNSCALLSH